MLAGDDPKSRIRIFNGVILSFIPILSRQIVSALSISAFWEILLN